MANMELITSVTVGAGGAASVTLPATGTIPATYTDLMLVISARSDRSGNIADGYLIKPNNTTPTIKYSTGDGTTAYSGTNYSGIFPAATATASTFGNSVAYFPNYANTSNYKSFSVDDVSENNATGAYATLSANLYSSNSAITTIVVQSINAANIVEGSTFYLYGISNVTSGTKATGGVVSTDGTYYYHMFPFSGTFTPTQSLTADILVVGGGGSGGANIGGGGGAGGLRYFASESLTATGYTCTVGAGGPGPITTPSYQGSNGGTSQFGALTSAVGGGYGGGANDGSPSGSGASSGGNRGTSNPIGSASLGNIGAAHTGINGAGGGGGFGGAGTQGTSTTGGTGGVGTAAYSAFAYATGTGDKGYYAGGGGGSGFSFGSGGPFGFGGLGGGADGMVHADDSPKQGKQSTGGGGGGGFNNGTTNPVQYNNGGSGVIIIRYLI